MPEQVESASIPTRRRIGLAVEVRRTEAGFFRHAPSADHHLIVHAGSPIRVSCHVGARAVRSRGEINLLPAGITEEAFQDDPAEAVEVTLPSSLVRLAAEDLGLDPDRAGVEAQYHFRDSHIEHIAWTLEAEWRAGMPNGLVFRESLGIALAVHLLARYRAHGVDQHGLSKPQLRRVVDYIEEHLSEDVSLLRLARVAGVSTSRFRELFKRSMGLAVHQYVIQRRVERARALLERGDLPASQIALDAGFSHQSHMARCMRRVLGVTPKSIARARSWIRLRR